MSFLGTISEAELGLFVDLYELTMARAYHVQGLEAPARFSLHFRNMARRNFIVACGQHYAALLVTQMRFPAEQVRRLASLGQFDDEFLAWLTEFRFSGEIRTVPEGTPLFPHEPLLEVEAPLAEAQLLETMLMNYISTETVLATKAVRVMLAAQGRPVVDFGMRRMHGFDAALRGVRAYRTAGLVATSNVLGSLRYGLPATGTMAHSYIQAHDDELAAFRAFARLYPGSTLLVDTYDTLRGVDKVIALVRDEGCEVGAIRIDSGDLGQLAFAAREKLDSAGLQAVRIIVSSGLDEWSIRALVAAGAPIDAFGVGTRMGVSEDAPSVDLAYKLTEYAGEPRLKSSPGKLVLPGRKQVWRQRDATGRISHDELGLEAERRNGEALLMTVVRDGECVGAPPDPAQSREHLRRTLEQLPEALLALEVCDPGFPVHLTDELQGLYRQTAGAVAGADSAAGRGGDGP